MPTGNVLLDVTQYVRVNIGQNPITLQSHRDAVRVVFADSKPARSNPAFHVLSGNMPPLIVPDSDTNIWALATSADTALSATEFVLNNPTAITQGAKDVFVTEFGELTVGMRIDDISINFHYGTSTRDTVDLSTGTGSLAEVGSDAAIDCGAGVGEGRLESLDSVRYRPGHDLLVMFTHDQTELQAGVDVIHGLLNTDDGLGMGSQGIDAGLWFMEGGNENFTAQADFSIDKLDGTGISGFNWDPTKRNLFAISFGYLGIAPIRYYVHTGSKGWVEFHNFMLMNTQTTGHLKNPTLPMAAVVRRASGSGTSVRVKTGSWRAGTIGPEQQVNASNRWVTVQETRINLPAVDTGLNPLLYENIFTIRNNATFKSKNNHIRAQMAIVNFVVDANKSVEFVAQINSALAGNGAFVPIDAANSPLDVSLNGSSTGAVAGASTTVAKDGDRRSDVRETNIYVRPGQTFTLGARGVNGIGVTGDVSSSFRIIQEF